MYILMSAELVIAAEYLIFKEWMHLGSKSIHKALWWSSISTSQSRSTHTSAPSGPSHARGRQVSSRVSTNKFAGRNSRAETSGHKASGRQSRAPLLWNLQLPAFTSNNSKRSAPVLPLVVLLRFPKLQESNQTIFKRRSQKDLALLFLSICAEPASDAGLHRMAISQRERTDL